MDEVFENLLITLRNSYPCFFSKNKAIDINIRNDNCIKFIPHNYLYNMTCTKYFNHENIDYLFNMNEKHQLIFLYISYYGYDFKKIEKIIEHIKFIIDNKCLCVFFMDERYNINDIIKDNFQKIKVENYVLYIYLRL